MHSYKICAVLADLHIGVKHISAKTIKSQLKHHFFQVLDKMYRLDGVFICGDILHTALSLSSDYASVYIWFINKLYSLAKKRKCTVVIIRGTIAHDGQALTTIRSYERLASEDKVDFRVYDTVEEITLWDDYKVLVLPDVKVKQLQDIGKHLKHKQYDMILGHGLIDQMQFFVQDSENMSMKSYVFDVSELRDACRGPILFGHIHKHMNIGNQFYYVGPFTLLERGSDTTTGFCVVGISDDDRTKYKVEQYINPDSAAYYEINVTNSILNTYPIDDIVEAIDEIAADARDNDLITLRITRGDETESAEKVMILETRYRRDHRFSIIKKIKNKKEEEHEQRQAERKNKYAYLMDENMELPSILYTYYINDVKSTFPDKGSVAASLELADFQRALNMEETSTDS